MDGWNEKTKTRQSYFSHESMHSLPLDMDPFARPRLVSPDESKPYSSVPLHNGLLLLPLIENNMILL
jgi:hypothetical protein